MNKRVQIRPAKRLIVPSEENKVVPHFIDEHEIVVDYKAKRDAADLSVAISARTKPKPLFGFSEK